MKQALAALGVSEKEVYVTAEAAAKCRRSKRTRTDFRQETLNQALDFLKQVHVISKLGDLEELKQLENISNGMDTGETTLFLATKDLPDFLLLTGDKNALRALTDNFLSQELHNRHLRRVVCLESLILLILKQIGFASIQMKLIGGQGCDEAIKNCLNGGKASEAEFVRSMESYIRKLEEETQGLLKQF